MSSADRTSTPLLPPFLPPESDQPAVPVTPGGPIVPPLPIRSVRCGCWLISYRPGGSPFVA
jgi:hypothetical protein